MIYFNDVRDIICHLSQLAGEEIAEVHCILEEPWNPQQIEFGHALRVVNAFFLVWERHRDILRICNLEADGGDKTFYELQLKTAVPIITRLAERISAAYAPGQGLARGDALADAMTLLCAMEGIAETDPVHVRKAGMSSERLTKSMARFIARSICGRSSTGAPAGT